MKRARRPELMDDPDVDREELWRSLRDLEWFNRYHGGHRSAVRDVLALAARVPSRPVSILDVATGGADVARAVSAGARRRGISARIVATDIHPATLEFARRATAGEPDIDVQHADALDLPFGEDEFDLAMMTLTLHHFRREDAIRVLEELDRVARHGFVVTDLERSWRARLGAWLMGKTLWRNHPVTRHDGEVSAKAAFTIPELRELTREALGIDPRVRRVVPVRLSMVVDRTPARETGG